LAGKATNIFPSSLVADVDSGSEIQDLGGGKNKDPRSGPATLIPVFIKSSYWSNFWRKETEVTKTWINGYPV
jgi:hypothetical protein